HVENDVGHRLQEMLAVLAALHAWHRIDGCDHGVRTCGYRGDAVLARRSTHLVLAGDDLVGTPFPRLGLLVDELIGFRDRRELRHHLNKGADIFVPYDPPTHRGEICVRVFGFAGDVD